MYKLDPVTPPNPHRTKPPGPSVKPPWYATGCRRLVDRFSSLTSIGRGQRGRGDRGGGERGERSYVLSTPFNGVVAGRSQECSEKTQRGCWWWGVGNGGMWAALMRTSWETQTVHHSLCFIPFFSALCLSLVCLFSLPAGRSAVFCLIFRLCPQKTGISRQ